MVDLLEIDQHSHITIDITIPSSANYYYMATITRNYEGSIVFSYLVKAHISIPKLVETRAILQVMEVLLSQNFSNTIIENVTPTLFLFFDNTYFCSRQGFSCF